jgi:chemotaxis protein methyltransferase CheR
MTIRGGAEPGWTIPELTDGDLQRFRTLILEETGIRLTANKRPLLISRLAQRVRELGLDSFRAYFDQIMADISGRELIDFINRITTNKTSFFRESHHFDFLRDRLIPELRAQGRSQIRIWSAACSSGEEPYSIAMILREALGAASSWDISILASDIDTEMLGRAQAGIYPLNALEEINEPRRKAHFLRGYGDFEGCAQLRLEVRRMVRFRRINLIDSGWPAEESFDAIFCRNAIIYFGPETQRRILERLARGLAPHGYLFVGHSENLHWMSDWLTPVGITIYRPVERKGRW